MSSGQVGVDDMDDLGDLDNIGDRPGHPLGDAGGGGVVGDDGGGDDEDPDDSIVLPWWQHPFNIVVIVVTAALLAGMVGWMVGDSSTDRDSDPVDVGFLQDMREHHEQAVSMGFLYLAVDGTEPGLRAVARSIVFGQGIEIGRMIQLLRDLDAAEVNEGDTSMAWMGSDHSVPLGQMPGMASDAELDELAATTGADADDLFVELMVRHHEGGIEMAEYAAANATDDEVRAMAASITDSQRDEITELERLVD